MSEVLVPDYGALYITQLDINVPAQSNESEFTGRTQTVGLPGAEKWYGSFAVDPRATESDEQPWRAFLFGLKGIGNHFKLNLPLQSHMGSKPTVASGATAGYTLPLTGLIPDTYVLNAGQFITVPLPSGHFRTCALTANLVSDGIGNATAVLNCGLYEIPTLAAVVETVQPFIPVRLINRRNGISYSGTFANLAYEVVENL